MSTAIPSPSTENVTNASCRPTIRSASPPGPKWIGTRSGRVTAAISSTPAYAAQASAMTTRTSSRR